VTRARGPEDGLLVEDTWLDVDEGLRCAGRLVRPEGLRCGPGVLWLHGRGEAGLGAHWDGVRTLAASGVLVFAFWPRGTGPEAPSEPAGQPRLVGSLLGTESQWARQALMCGQALPAMRARDIAAAVAYLASRPDVDSASVYICAEGRPSLWALLAAASDPGIAGLVLKGLRTSFDGIATHSRHRFALADVLPGILSVLDVPDLVRCIAPLPLTLVSPLDHMGEPVSDNRAHVAFGQARKAYRAVGAEDWFEIRTRTTPGVPDLDATASLRDLLGRAEGHR